MVEFKGRLVQPESASRGEPKSTKKRLEKLLAGISVSTAAAIALAACGIAEGSTNPQTQSTEPVPLTSPTPDTLKQPSSIELFDQFITNQIESGHRFSTPTVFSSSEGKQLNPEQKQSIEQLVNTFVGLAQNQKVLNFSSDGLGVNTDSLGQIMIEDTLVFDFGKKGKSGMFLVGSETGNKAYYLSNNGEVATQLVFSVRYKDGTVEAFFDPKQVEVALKETDPSLIESTNWNGIFMRPEVMGDNPTDGFFATTKQMQYEGEGTPFLYNVLSLDQQQNLAMLDPGTLDFGFFKVETAANAEPTEEPTPAPIFGSKMLMSILAPTPTVEEVVPTVEPTPTAEPIPTLSPDLTGGIEGVPDPRVTNPEMFDLTNGNAPIPQFIESMNKIEVEITGQQILDAINDSNNFQRRLDSAGNPYLQFRYRIETSDQKVNYSIAFNYYPEKGWVPVTLKQIGNINNIDFGAHGIARRINSYPEYRQTLADNYNLVMSEGEFRIETVMSTRNSPYDFTKADALVKFAEANGMKIQAHHLVRDEMRHYPDWLTDGSLSKTELQQVLVDYITKTVDRYKGQGIQWSVINEPYDGNNNPWIMAFGRENYMQVAFDTAREADSTATLLINERLMETDSSRVSYILKRILDLNREKHRVDGVGFQLHIDGSRPLTENQIIAAMEKFTNAGIAVYVTELEVDMTNYKGSGIDKQIKQAEIYNYLLKAFLKAGCRSITTFGFSDSVSSLGDGEESFKAAPLPFDKNFEPKPALFAMLDAVLDFNSNP